VSAVAIVAAARFSHAPPPPASTAPGVKVTPEDDALTLAPGVPQWKVLKLGTVAAASTHLTDPVPARVRIDETAASRVGTPLGGRVTQVFVELGQRVKKGDKLFSVASADIADLRADTLKATVDLAAAKAQLDRVKALVEAHALPAKEEVAATQAYKQAELSVRLGQSKVASLQVSPKADNEFTVTAPRDGFVVEKNVLPAQQVSRDAAEPLMSVADLANVWVLADLFDRDAAGIRAGTAAQITFPSLPDVKLDATVEMVSTVVDPVRHTVPVRVRVPNPDGTLKPNIYAQMRFAVPPRPGTVEAPASALVSDGPRQFVYVQDSPGHFVRREVVAGSAREGKVEIAKGLEPGETLVEQGAILIDNHIALAR
jgi:RND family efflux transporter MFP subunit